MEKSNSKATVFSALCTTLLIICSWISVPSAVPFTMQTFAVAFLGAFLGSRRSILAVSTYILLGIVGFPVFSGFRSGASAILGFTGGYTLGFLPFCAVTGFLSNKTEKSYLSLFLSMLVGLIVCYICGTLWYSFLYLSGTKSVWAALSSCVFPFIIPDLIKIFLAAVCVKKTENLLK